MLKKKNTGSQGNVSGRKSGHHEMNNGNKGKRKRDNKDYSIKPIATKFAKK